MHIQKTVPGRSLVCFDHKWAPRALFAAVLALGLSACGGGGTEDPVTDISVARRVAAEIGFPLIVKAAFGGGGRGMRIVANESEFEAKIAEARQEAAAAFGNDAVFLERYIRRAKHIEVQILGDHRGNILHLYERDCSVQRRHQKVVEVAPAVALDTRIRDEVCAAAVRIAREAKYFIAATVDFLGHSDSGDW